MKYAQVMVLGLTLVLVATASLHAENEGQADLDKATAAKIQAKNVNDLEEVIKLCDSALKKGLDDGGKKFANQMLTSTLYQKAEVLSRPILGAAPAKVGPQVIRDLTLLAIRDLERAVTVDPTQADAQYLLARLSITPFGDPDRARKAIGEAVKLHKDDAEALARDYVVRAALAEKPEAQLADLDEAIKLDNRCADAYRVRGQVRMAKGKFEEAEADFDKLATLAPDDLTALEGLTEAFTAQKKFDQALAFAGKVIAAAPDLSGAYLLRARVHLVKEDAKGALTDLNEAIRKEPRDVRALLMRSQVRQSQKELDLAEADVARVLEIVPNFPAALLSRAGIAAAGKKFDKAAADLEQLAKLDEKNVPLRLQLASVYGADGRLKKAHEIVDKLLQDDPKNAAAHRTRGDLFLNTGKQAEAVADYEAALKEQPENTGVLNNLAWVLATATNDKVRNAARAIELGTKAAELTKFKQAHILSTLAAGYAEKGDFDKAVEWSTKAVEVGKNDEDKEQLEKELASYKAKKPWREEKKTAEKPETPEAKPSPDDVKGTK